MSPLISRVASPGGAGGSSFLRKFRNRKFIVKPIMLGPTNGASEIVRKPTFVASSYSFVGSVGSHVSTDWQVSTSSTFGTIAAQSLNNTSNKTSYTLPSDLNLNTLYYARVRYTDGTDVSEWSDPISFTTSQFLPFLSNGTQTITSNAQTWTVPAGIGQVRITLNGGRGGAGSTTYGNGGKIVVKFSVTPGETLRFDNFGGSWAFGVNAGVTLIQATLLAIVGSGGGAPRNYGSFSAGNIWHSVTISGYLSNGGGDTGHGGMIGFNQDSRYGVNGLNYGTYQSYTAKGGSQSAGGAGGVGNHEWSPGSGGPLYGAGAARTPSNSNHYTGSGGYGWFGGGAGAAAEWRNYNFGNPGSWSIGSNKGWGGGGSSRIQLGSRLVSTEENSTGTSTLASPLIEY